MPDSNRKSPILAGHHMLDDESKDLTSVAIAEEQDEITRSRTGPSVPVVRA